MATNGDPAVVASRDQQLMVFFSADLVNGTDFKNRRPTEYFPLGGNRPAWPVRFEAFFKDFMRDFQDRVMDAREHLAEGSSILAPPHLWKINGDEILFIELVYPNEPELFSALSTSVRAFVGLTHSYDTKLLPEGMGLRGCVWTAGFPIRNRRIRIDQGIRILRPESTDFETGAYTPDPTTVTDYIGRDMDLGFRLVAVTPPARVCCSLDVAWYVASAPEHSRLFVSHVGWRQLKGVLGGHPYPIFWLDVDAVPKARHPWETWENQTTDEVRRHLTEPFGRVEPKDLKALADELRSQLPEHLIRPYASSREMDAVHARVWSSEPPTTLRVSDSGDVSRSDFSAPANSVRTITLDELNQIQILLRSADGTAEHLRSVLHEISSHEAYISWTSEEQFEGLLFRIPPGLVFSGDDERRLLERLLLVDDDVLRVKLNVCDDGIFLTDGLWVSGEFRVFPFVDESDLVMRACMELGWMDWATCVVDPAMGCGHNVLRYEGSARRHGFDLNARAVAYAAINAAINGIRPAALGVNDIRDGLPSLFRQQGAERVLIIGNMPFALVPEAEVLPTSAAGGRFGYELTVELLQRVSELRDSLDRASQLRCVILSYSVGSKSEDAWVVPGQAARLFGADHVGWRLWEDEKVWRVNGRKEQPNPMPLTSLELKAGCRFYVRDESNREVVREKYQRLTQELTAKGWDHLAYGVVTTF